MSSSLFELVLVHWLIWTIKEGPRVHHVSPVSLGECEVRPWTCMRAKDLCVGHLACDSLGACSIHPLALHSDGDYSTSLQCAIRLSRCGLRMAHPVVANVGQMRRAGVPSSRVHSVRTRSFALPHGLTRKGISRTLGLVDLLGGDLVVCLAARTCSAGTWSYVSPRRLAQWGLWSSILPHRLARQMD